MADNKEKEVKTAKPEKEKQAKTQKTPKKKKLRTYQQRQDRAGYAFMMPWIIGFVIFTLFPFVMTIYLSFTNVKSTILGYEIEWTGLDNYYTAFFQNESFLPALLSYLKMIIPYTFIVVVLSFIIAYLLCKINTGKSILRTIYFLPVIIMSGPVMTQLLSVQSAASSATSNMSDAAQAANAYSNIFIMQIIDSYSPSLANGLAGIFDQLSIILWFTGIPIVLFINGLQKINPSIYEAAKIDSANAWQIMWKITIPMLKSVGLIITVFTVIQLGMYDSINPVYELIEDATGDTNGGLGFAATYAWVYSIIALLIIGIVFLLFRDRKPKDIKARQKQEKKLKKLEKQQRRRLAGQKRHQAKEAKLYGK
jgi:ABC-type sugar transport system permease subunit